MFGVRLLLYHPKIARMSCEDCQRYSHKKGEWSYRGERSNREKQPRPPGTITPCYECPKIPYGKTPFRWHAQELSEKNWRACQHYLECRAVGLFPDDPIVRRNAAILRTALDEFERDKLAETLTLGISRAFAK